MTATVLKTAAIPGALARHRKIFEEELAVMVQLYIKKHERRINA
jgi:hypothetical protein